MLVNSETASKETLHSFGLTVIFLIVSKNGAELSIEYGELAVKGLRKPFRAASTGQVKQGDNHT